MPRTFRSDLISDLLEKNKVLTAIREAESSGVLAEQERGRHSCVHKVGMPRHDHVSPA